ncbi:MULTISPECIES: hypothetical protein [Haloferax]|nr:MULTISPECIES: hypothetical protein [Haloferax]
MATQAALGEPSWTDEDLVIVITFVGSGPPAVTVDDPQSAVG